MDDLMTGINTSGGMDDIGGMPQHSLPSAQSVYDPASAAPAEPAGMPKSSADDINDVLAQMNNAFGNLGSETAHQTAPQPVQQPAQPMGMGQPAQPMGMGQQEQPVKTNENGYSSDDYKYDPRRMNYGSTPQRSSSYGMQDPYNSAGYGGYSAAPHRSEGGEFSAILMGVLGAVIGAIPGMLLMILVARFGFIASLCGAAMAAMIFGGYKLMTKNSLLSTKTGMIICGAVMALAVFLAVRISWTFALRDALGLAKSWMSDLDDYGFTDTYYKGLIGDEEPTFGNCWDNFGKILAELGYKGRFIASLAENYLFAGLGCAGVFAKFGRNY